MDKKKPTFMLPLSYMLPSDYVCCLPDSDADKAGRINALCADFIDPSLAARLVGDNKQWLPLFCGTQAERDAAFQARQPEAGDVQCGHILDTADAAFAALALYRWATVGPEQALATYKNRVLNEFRRTVQGTLDKLQARYDQLGLCYDALLERLQFAHEQPRVFLRLGSMITEAAPLLWTACSWHKVPAATAKTDAIVRYAFSHATGLVMARVSATGSWEIPDDSETAWRGGARMPHSKHDALDARDALTFAFNAFVKHLDDVSDMVRAGLD